MNAISSILIGNIYINAFCLLLVFVVILYNYSYLFSYRSRGTGYFALWFVITCYSVLYSPMHGDNFTSMQKYNDYLSGEEELYLHFETIYFRIMDLVPYGYVVWRFAIWGFGAFLLVWYIKRMKFNIHVATIAILFFSLPLLYYQRAIIGYVLLSIALALFVNIQNGKGPIWKQWKRTMAAICCMLLALPFHTTMVLYAAIMLLAVFIPKKKWVLACVLALCLVIPILFNYISSELLLFTAETQEMTETYVVNADAGESSNIFGIIRHVFQDGPFYVMLICCLININTKRLSFNRYEQTTLINTCFLVLISLAISSISPVIQGKFYMASLLPWGLFLSSYYTRCRKNIIYARHLKKELHIKRMDNKIYPKHTNSSAAMLFSQISFVCFFISLSISIISGSFVDLFN